MFALQSSFLQEQIRSHKKQVAQANLFQAEINSLILPIPPIAEQHRIVAAIESAFCVIDEIEQGKADLYDAVVSVKSKILSLAIRGKLVPQDPNDEPASILLERIRAEREILIKAGKIKRGKGESIVIKSDDNSYYTGLPHAWTVCRLGELAHYKKGPFGSSITKAMFVPKSDTVIKVYEQKNAIYKDASLGNYFISHERFNVLKSFEVFEDDIIISCAGTIGEAYVIPKGARKGIINQALMKVSLYDKRITKYYLLYFDYILKELAQQESKGTAIKNIPPFEILKQFTFPLPPLAEQYRIVSAVEMAFEQLNNITTMLE
jgi:type I restriction enzyme S subunit